MKNWTDFKDDQQISDWIAENVMEWEHIEGIWYEDNGQTCGYDRLDSIRGKGFNPLIDHNHAALVRAKMRDMGYRRAVDEHNRFIAFSYPLIEDTDSPKQWSNYEPVEQELRAEMQAVYEAITKEREHE